MTNGWALKAKGRDIYIAAQQYGPRGSLTFSSRKGNPGIYSPRVFETREHAEVVLKSVVEADSKSPFQDQWEIVEIDLMKEEAPK